MEDKLIFHKKRKPDGKAQSRQIRISSGLYDRILVICKETGLGIREVADRLLSFAVEKTELAEANSVTEVGVSITPHFCDM